MSKYTFPKVTLSNGITVGNFSSPHPFTFEDGSVLEACTAEHTQLSALRSEEFETPGIKGSTDINLQFFLTPALEEMMEAAEVEDDVDIFLIPFPLLQVLREEGRPIGKFRVIRNTNRITKAVSIDRFCI